MIFVNASHGFEDHLLFIKTNVMIDQDIPHIC